MDEGFMNLIAKADAGDVEAMVMVGDCYNRGFHADKDDFKAQTYYKMAADKGHAAAAFMVGLGYLFGTGVKKDKANAIKYIQDAAVKGFANAQHMMGMMYQAERLELFLKSRMQLSTIKWLLSKVMLKPNLNWEKYICLTGAMETHDGLMMVYSGWYALQCILAKNHQK